VTDPSTPPVIARLGQSAPFWRSARFWIPVLIGAAILGVGVSPVGPMVARNWDRFAFAPHSPDWDLFAGQSLAIKLHVLAALAALGLGIVMFVRRKGTGMHKTLGWGWVALMAVTAGSSLFITEINRDTYSPIHLLSGWTLVSLPLAIYAIRRGKVRSHQGAMTGLFFGGLIVAGALSFIPGRFMYDFLLG